MVGLFITADWWKSTQRRRERISASSLHQSYMGSVSFLTSSHVTGIYKVTVALCCLACPKALLCKGSL